MSINLRNLVNAVNSTNKIITPSLAEWIIRHGDDALSEAVADKIHELLTTQPRYRGGSFSASSSGMCERRQVLQFLGPREGVIDTRLANIFSDGKWRHLRWQSMLLMAGLLTDIEEPLDWPAKRTRGTMDGLGIVSDDHPKQHWRGQEFGFELKGVSGFLYPKWSKALHEPHRRQVHKYFAMSGLKLFVIVYEDKSTQEWTEWVIEPDPQLMDETLAEIDRLNDAVDSRRLPTMLPQCKLQRGPEWKGCPMGGAGGPCVSAGKWPTHNTPGFEDSQVPELRKRKK